MSAPVFPIERLLVPEAVEGPTGFTRIEQPLVTGLPATIELTDGYSLVLTIASGLASAWRDADPQLIVTQSFNQTIALPHGPRQEVGAVDRMPARLTLAHSGEILGAVPLVAGLRRRLPDSGQVAIELIVLGWEIRAGSMRGAGDFGSNIRLVWRRADGAVAPFLPPPVSPTILSRLRDRSRGASELGTGVRRLPAGYGPPAPPPPPPATIDDADFPNFLIAEEVTYDVDYYTTYDVP